MIIRRRSLRVLSKHRPVGRIGTRTLRRSLAQARRMLVSRQPDQAPQDWQEAIAQPLIWGTPTNLQLPVPSSDAVIDSMQTPSTRRTTASPSAIPFAPSEVGGNIQRQAETEEERAMPRDLQRIFDMHRSMGHVNDNANLVDLIKNKGTAPAPKGRGNAPVQRRPASSPTAPTASNTPFPSIPDRPSWKQPDTTPTNDTPLSADDLPVVVEPQPRRVRSRVEYVNRPEPDAGAQPQVQAQRDTNPSIARQPDEIIDEDVPFTDFGDDAPTSDDYDAVDDVPRVVSPQPVQRDVESSTVEDTTNYTERPTERPGVQRSVESDLPPTIIHQGEVIEDTLTPSGAEARPRASVNPDVVQRAIEQAERPSDTSGTPPTSVQPLTDDPITGRENLSQIREISDTPTTPAANMPVQRTPSAPTPPASGIPQQRVSRQAQAIQRAIEQAERPSTVQRSADTPAPTIFEDGSYGFTEPDPLPEQELDLGAALFADLGQRPTRSLLEPDGPDAPTPVMMPPIGKARPREGRTTPANHEVSSSAVQRAIERAEAPDPRSTQERAWEASESISDPLLSPDYPTLVEPNRASVQRQTLSDTDAESSVQRQILSDSNAQSGQAVSDTDDPTAVQRAIAIEKAIRRAESPATSSDYADATPEEAQLLTVLNLPANTPIQRGGAPMPNIQASFDDADDLQRAIEIDEVTTSVSGDDSSTEGGGEVSETELNDMAQKVYGIIKRRLRNENERLKGKK